MLGWLVCVSGWFCWGVSDVLSDREQTIAVYHPSLVMPVMQFIPVVLLSVLGGALVGGAVGWGLVGLVVLVMLVRVLYRLQFSWHLTNERLIEYRGVLVRDMNVVRFDSVTDMRVRKPLMANLFGTGTLRVNTAGSEGYQIVMFGQHQASLIEAEIVRAKRDYLARYRAEGLHTPRNP
jgi:uncharacterized membrane protein YdbT with pleckstrin-like domain